MIKIAALVVTLFFVANVFGTEEYCITNYGITVCGSIRTAGAIDYIMYNGVQYVNAYDHGRELQIAITNHSNECYNPTEAGCVNDGAGRTSSSKLLAVNLNGEILRTTSQPAFWVAPGHPGSKCTGVNHQVVSNYIIDKAVTIGYAGYTNAIFYQFDVHVPEYQAYLQIEAPTGYMPIAFNTFYNLNLTSGNLTSISGGPTGGETPDPVIISTSDSSHAMGSFLQGASFTQYARYARYSFANMGVGSTSKWSNVWRTNVPPPTDVPISFNAVICIGSLSEVQKCMFAIAQSQGFVA